MVCKDEKNRMGGRDVVVLTLIASSSGVIDHHALSLKSVNPHGLLLLKKIF